MKTPLFILIWSLALASSVSQAAPCGRAQEYDSAIEFIRGAQDLKLSKMTLEDLAQRVSEGCSGAADRFKRVTHLMARSGMASREAVQTALEFAKKSDLETDSFIAIFEGTFGADHLEMDLRSAVGLAHSLSTQFNGDPLAAKANYERLLNFCLGRKNMDLPPSKCPVFAAKLAQIGANWPSSIAQPYIRIFKYLRTRIPQTEAMRFAEDLVSIGPVSPDTFIRAFEYANDKRRGLGLSVQESLSFARRMTSQNRAFSPPTAEFSRLELR